MRTWDLWLCLGVYTITFFWFGMWIQKTYDNFQLKGFEETAWNRGCYQCAGFEKGACERDQLQGVSEHPKIKR